MLADLQDLKFLLMLGHFCGAHLLLIDGLDSNLHTGDAVRCQTDDTEGALTKLAMHFEVVFQAFDPS